MRAAGGVLAVHICTPNHLQAPLVDCFTAFVADVYAAAAGDTPTVFPRSPTVCAPPSSRMPC